MEHIPPEIQLRWLHSLSLCDAYAYCSTTKSCYDLLPVYLRQLAEERFGWNLDEVDGESSTIDNYCFLDQCYREDPDALLVWAIHQGDYRKAALILPRSRLMEGTVMEYPPLLARLLEEASDDLRVLLLDWMLRKSDIGTLRTYGRLHHVEDIVDIYLSR